MSGRHFIHNVDRGHPITRGLIEGVSVVHKFGAGTVGTTYAPIARGAIYRTPQVSAATTLRVKAGNINDTAAGSGARAVTLIGINSSGEEIEETIATNGTSAGTASTNSFMRIFRAYISASGTYATQSVGSHAADVVIENSAGTEDWATIALDGFPMGQTEIGAYTIPIGKTGYIQDINLTVDASKSTSIIGFRRNNILETAAPYSAMRSFFEAIAITGDIDFRPSTPIGPFPALTDIGFMAKVGATTGTVEVNFEIILIDS